MKPFYLRPLHSSLTLALLVATPLATTQLAAEVSLAPIFSDHLVLPHGKNVTIWGQANPKEPLSVSFAGQTHDTRADTHGEWAIKLEPLEPNSSPTDLVVEASNSIRIEDVLVGEVWLCSGQSNMEWNFERLRLSTHKFVSSENSIIRHLKIPQVPSSATTTEFTAEWTPATVETVKDFSAVAYLFGLELQRELNMPIGLVNSSYGGTQIESWISEEALADSQYKTAINERWQEMLDDYPRALEWYKKRLKKWETDRIKADAADRPFTARKPRMPYGPGSQREPNSLYNGMIYPLLPFTFTGVIWYQGESNAPRHAEYAELFVKMIEQWRKDFNAPELPFYFVQLANMERSTGIDPTGRSWAFLREAQAAALTLPKTGMAVTYDIGEADNIHPKNKQDVGKRLARLALAQIHDQDIESIGPRYSKYELAEGGFKVFFEHADGLHSDNSELIGFEIAGEDQVFVPATAIIENDTVFVSNDTIEAPRFLRYNWVNNPTAHFYNATNLPAEAFRTDQ